MAKLPLNPKHPDRVCWGCDKYCAADHLDCGNGTTRTQHPSEVFGDDWLEWLTNEENPSVAESNPLPILKPQDSNGRP